jgi:hypothetical protein
MQPNLTSIISFIDKTGNCIVILYKLGDTELER